MSKIIVSERGFVDVYEDSYESGQGDQVNSWDFDVRGEYDTFEELVAAIDEVLYFGLTADDYVFIDGSIQSSASVDADNYPANDNDFELFKRGELALYIADVYLAVNVGDTHVMTEDDASSFGIDLR